MQDSAKDYEVKPIPSEIRFDLPMTTGGSRRSANVSHDQTAINVAVTKLLQDFNWQYVPIATK